MIKYIKYLYIACSIASFGLNQNLWGESKSGKQITFFAREYPIFVKEATNFAHKKDKLAHPSYPHIQKIKQLLDPDITNGIFATYHGFLALSAPDGQISFPNHIVWDDNKPPKVHLVITTRVTPIMMLGNTIHHWELEEKTPVAMYMFERTKDPNSDVYFWNVTEEKAPEDLQIYDAIVIFAKPDVIYVPTGIVLAEDAPNLHLPDVYVKPEINKISNALYVLYLKHFFGQIRRSTKLENKHREVLLTY
jgi:hypothetical protein